MTAAQITKHPRIGADAVFGTFGTNLVIQACTIVQGILLARLLGPVGRGEFAAVILWPNVFAAIGLFGVGTALGRRAGTEPDRDALTRAGLVLGLGLAFCTCLFCYLMMPLLLKGQDVNLVRMSKWFVPFIFFNQMTLVFVFIDQGCGDFKRYNWTRVLLYPIYLALVIGLWALGSSRVFPFVLALMAANAAVLALRVAKLFCDGPLLGRMCRLKPIAKDAFRFGLADLVSPLYQQIDKALLLVLLGVRDLGFYTVALAASGVAGSLASALSCVVFGISAQATGPEAYARISKVFRCSAWAWLMIGTALAFGMPFLLPLIFGKQFAPAIWPAIVLIPAGVFAGQASILEQSLRAQGRAFVGLEARILGLVAMVPIAWIASKFWGMLGVPLAYDLAQLLCLLVFCARTKAHFAQSTFSDLLPKSGDLRTIWTTLRHFFRSKSVGLLNAAPASGPPQ